MAFDGQQTEYPFPPGPPLEALTEPQRQDAEFFQRFIITEQRHDPVLAGVITDAQGNSWFDINISKYERGQEVETHVYFHVEQAQSGIPGWVTFGMAQEVSDSAPTITPLVNVSEGRVWLGEDPSRTPYIPDSNMLQIFLQRDLVGAASHAVIDQAYQQRHPVEAPQQKEFVFQAMHHVSSIEKVNPPPTLSKPPASTAQA